MYYVYVIYSPSIKKKYVGQTKNISKRLKEHLSAESFWTKRANDWKLIYKETYKTRSEAISREKYLKTGKGREEL